jgi:hypothetical protein
MTNVLNLILGALTRAKCLAKTDASAAVQAALHTAAEAAQMHILDEAKAIAAAQAPPPAPAAPAPAPKAS